MKPILLLSATALAFGLAGSAGFAALSDGSALTVADRSAPVTTFDLARRGADDDPGHDAGDDHGGRGGDDSSARGRGGDDDSKNDDGHGGRARARRVRLRQRRRHRRTRWMQPLTTTHHQVPASKKRPAPPRGPSCRPDRLPFVCPAQSA